MTKIKEKLEDIADFVTDTDTILGGISTGLGILATAATIGAGIQSYAYFNGQMEKIPYNPIGGVAWGALTIGAGIISIVSYIQAVKSFKGK